MAGLFDDIPAAATAGDSAGLFDDIPAAAPQTADQTAAAGWGPGMNIANGVLMGAGPKMLAYIQSMRPGAPADAYQQALNHYEQERDAWSHANPKTAAGTFAAGSLPVAAAGTVLAPEGMAGSALVGALTAGAPAAIENDGSGSDKLAAAAKAALLGGGVGAAAAPVGSLISKGVGAGAQKLVNAWFNKTNPAGLTTGAADALASQIGAQGQTPAQAVAAAQAMGKGAVLADAGPGTQSLTAQLATNEPKVAPVIAQNLTDRASNLTPRINDVLDQNFGHDFNAEAQKDALKVQTSRIGQGYDPILNSGATVNLKPTHALLAGGQIDPLLAGVKPDPITAALKGVQSQIIGNDPSAVPISVAHRAVGTLKDSIDSAVRNGQGSLAHELIPVRQSVLDAMPPEYNAVRQQYAQAKDIEDAFQQGRNVFSPRQDGQTFDPDLLTAHFAGMSGPERQAYQLGGRKALADMAGKARSDSAGFTSPFANDGGYNAGKAAVLFGQGPTDALIKELGQQATMRATNNLALAGSKTAQMGSAKSAIPTADIIGGGHGLSSILGGAGGGAFLGGEMGEKLGDLVGQGHIGAAVGMGLGALGGGAVIPAINASRLAAQNASRDALAKTLTTAPGQPLIDALSSRAALSKAGPKASAGVQAIIRALAASGGTAQGDAPQLRRPF